MVRSFLLETIDLETITYMAKSRVQKEVALKKITDNISSKGVVFFSFGGLTVTAQEELRTKLRAESAGMTVAKRQLLLLALKEQGLEMNESLISGEVAVAIADDEVAPAKVVNEFKKQYEQVQFYGGLLEHRFVDATEVEQLAQLPSKTELLAKVVGSMNAPVSGFVNVMAGNLRGMVQVLNAIKEAKQ